MLISRAACYTDRLKLAIQSRLRTTLLSLTRPPIRRRIARRNLRPPQRDQMAALVGIAPHLRAVLAAHVPLQFVDRRRLRPAHDVERDGLMRVAAETADLKVLAASPLPNLPRLRALALFGRRSVERAEPLCCRRPKTITEGDVAGFGLI
jgi:hypothetical protein